MIGISEENIGILCLEHVKNDHQWQQDEICFACQLADQINIAYINKDKYIATRQIKKHLSAIEQAAEGIVITDTNGNIEYVNPAFENITGYQSHEAIGQNPNILKSGKQDRSFYEELWKTISGGKTWRGQIINRKKDGTNYTEEATISPVFDTMGSIINYVAVKRDISEYLQLQEDKDIVDNQYKQALKMEAIGRLAGGVAHDLNNLITPILGYSELMLEDCEFDEEYQMYLEQILGAGERARDLVRQLLAFSRKQDLEMVSVNINDIINGFWKLLRRTIREDVNINLQLFPHARYVQADVGQIEQVIMNLAINAQDAMPEGGNMTIETDECELDEAYAATHPGVKPGYYMMMAISDTGHGMDPETKERIFTPFFTTKERGKGTGLGLATVYGIIKQHGGNIWVYSEPNYGTVFKIYLMICEPSKQNINETFTEVHETIGNETVMIVEDDSMVRTLAINALKRRGYKILASSSGIECIEMLQCYKGSLDILLTDIIMPGMNGKELYHRIKIQYPDIKVIFMSGYTDNFIVKNDLHELGANFIQKPFTVQNLTKIVKETLEK